MKPLTDTQVIPTPDLLKDYTGRVWDRRFEGWTIVDRGCVFTFRGSWEMLAEGQEKVVFDLLDSGAYWHFYEIIHLREVLLSSEVENRARRMQKKISKTFAKGSLAY